MKERKAGAVVYVVAICLVLFTVPAYSQSDTEEQKTQGSPTVISDITVTATKTPTPSELIPVTAHSVTMEEIERQPSHFISNFGELIRDLPGVHVGQYFPWGPPWVHLRGTGYFIGRTIYLVDGIPVSPFLSPTINNNDIQRVDVLLGPSSALYGANASGGAVNIITKNGADQQDARISLGYGSHDTWRPHASVGDKKGNLNYYLSYSGDYSDGYHMKPLENMLELHRLGKQQYLWDASYERNKHEFSYLMGKIGWENDMGMGLSASYNFQDLYLYGGQEGHILNDNGQQGISSFKFYTPIGDLAKITATLGYQHYDRPQKNVRGLSLVDGVLVQDSTPTNRSEWTMSRMPLELQADIFAIENNILTAGVFWSREEETREDYLISTGERRSKTDYTTDQLAFYLQNQMFLMDERLSLLAGIRYDEWKFHDIFDQASNPQRPDSIKKDNISYRGGARYRLTDSFSLKASAGTAYWPGLPLWFFRNVTTGMTWREANPDLEPEKTWMVDFGGELALNDWGTFVGITGYYGEIRDMVSYRYDENPHVPGGAVIRSLNLGKTEIQGVEFQLDQRLTDKLAVFGALTLNRSRIKDSGEITGNQLRNTPDYWGSLGVRYLDPKLFNVQATLRFSDQRYYDDENTDLPYFKMGAYETMDARIWRDWNLTEKIVLNTGLSINNIFDRKYETEFIYIHPGRTYQADMRLSYRF